MVIQGSNTRYSLRRPIATVSRSQRPQDIHPWRAPTPSSEETTDMLCTEQWRPWYVDISARAASNATYEYHRRSWRRASGRRHEFHNEGSFFTGFGCGIALARSHCTLGRIDMSNKVLRAVDQTHESTWATSYQSTKYFDSRLFHSSPIPIPRWSVTEERMKRAAAICV